MNKNTFDTKQIISSVNKAAGARLVITNTWVNAQNVMKPDRTRRFSGWNIYINDASWNSTLSHIVISVNGLRNIQLNDDIL